jgi:hypothetical protein
MRPDIWHCGDQFRKRFTQNKLDAAVLFSDIDELCLKVTGTYLVPSLQQAARDADFEVNSDIVIKTRT